MKIDEFTAIAGVLPEPAILVSATGDLLAANRPATLLLGCPASGRARLDEFVDDANGQLRRFLSACSRTRSMVPGALAVRRNGSVVRQRCQGAVVVPRTGESPSLLFVRFQPEETTSSRFALLTRQVQALTREMLVRQQVETERAKLLAEERKLRRQLQERSAELERQTQQAQELAAELEHQSEESQALAEEVEQANEMLSDALANTERARMAAEESERQFHEIADAAPVLIWRATSSGAFDWVNKPWLHFTGRALEDELGSGWAAGVHVDDRDRVVEAFARALGERRPFTTEHRLRAASGHHRWVRTTGTPRIAADGRFLGFIGSSIDVEDEHRAAERREFLERATRILNESLDLEYTMRALTRHAIPTLADYCSIDILTPEETIVRVSASHGDAAKEEILKEVWRRYPYDPSERVGVPEVLRTRRPLLVPSFPEEAFVAFTRDAEHLRMLRALNPRSYICVPLIARDIAYGALSLVMSDSGRTYTESDLELAIELGQRGGTAIDNARLYAAEQKIREAAEQAVARTQRLQDITAALSRATTPADVGRAVLEEGLAEMRADAGVIALFTADHRTLEVIAHRGYPGAMVGDDRFLPLEARVPLSDAVRDREPIVLTTAAEVVSRYPDLPLVDRAEACVALPLEVGADVLGSILLRFHKARAFSAEDRAFLIAVAQQSAQAFERARLYEAEHAARKTAESANRAKSQFLATMSHELRTPLNAIAGYAELMEMELHGPLTAAQREDLARIRYNQQHLLGVITDILNFSRLEAGQVEYALGRVPLRETLQVVEAMVIPLSRHRSITCEFVPCDEDHAALADHAKVEQIVLNLLSNALKFSDQGARVEVRCGGDDAVVWITVRDWGIGIPPEKLDAIFEPFVQVDPSLARRAEGTGLGLAISRDLALGMRGNLTVESVLGHGSTFTLTLPRA